MTYLQKYLQRYSNGCAIIISELRKFQALPLTKESLDDRIKAFEAIISALQDARRTLYFFKNVAGLPPGPPKPPGPPPGAA